ncbi:MAG: serine hydrolase domain-containing protein [Kiritimatiellia bacterium]
MKELNPSKLKETLEARADSDIRLWNIGGAAMAVSQHGEQVCGLYRGYKNTETKEPLCPGTIFRLASMTKPVTGLACLIGLERGWFRLDDKVSGYFPAFGKMSVGKLAENGTPVPARAAEKDVLIWHLLTHTSGIVTSDELGLRQDALTPPSVRTSLESAVDYYGKNTYLSFEPGEKTSYSGYAAFDIAARLIEIKSGMRYADFVRKNIFKPLGIADITFAPTNEQWGRMIAMCDRAVNGLVTVNMGSHTFEQCPLSYTCAGASLAGSLEDYLVFAEMLRRGGEYNGARIVSPELVRLMRRPYVPDGTPGLSDTQSWGLGVRVTLRDTVLPAGCFGWSGAYGTHFWVDPENDITAVYMKNMRWFDSHGGGNTGRQFERDVMSALE